MKKMPSKMATGKQMKGGMQIIMAKTEVKKMAKMHKEMRKMK